jgi:hypothetical protein
MSGSLDGMADEVSPGERHLLFTLSLLETEPGATSTVKPSKGGSDLVYDDMLRVLEDLCDEPENLAGGVTTGTIELDRPNGEERSYRVEWTPDHISILRLK